MSVSTRANGNGKANGNGRVNGRVTDTPSVQAEMVQRLKSIHEATNDIKNTLSETHRLTREVHRHVIPREGE